MRDAPWDDIFKLGASPAASDFCELAQLVLIYIPHRKYQIKPHLSPWFSSACSAAIVHRNHILHLYQMDKSPDTLMIAEGFLKLPNLHMLIKQKSPLLPKNLALVAFGKLLIVFSTKLNLLYLLY